MIIDNAKSNVLEHSSSTSLIMRRQADPNYEIPS